MTFYKTRRALNNFYNKDYITFIYKLNSAYKLLNTQLFLGQLLNKVYDNIQGKF